MDIQVIHGVLHRQVDPYTGHTLLDTLVGCDHQEDGWHLSWHFSYPAVWFDTFWPTLQQELQKQGVEEQYHATSSWEVLSHAVQSPAMGRYSNVKNIIVVGSGKGGVGKSTVSALLALALARMGVSVGLLDADVSGPNQPLILGQGPMVCQREDGRLSPVDVAGVKTLSMGYWVSRETSLAWRGPMLGGAVKQLLESTDWGALDYLIVDLPPGTGDIPMTLAKSYPIAGSVCVTTPHVSALSDLSKALSLFQKLSVPILGLVNNMTHFECPACQQVSPLFGSTDCEDILQAYDIPMMLSWPHRSVIVEGSGGSGLGTVMPVVPEAVELAYRVCGQLSLRPRNQMARFGTVVVESSKEGA